MRRLPFALRILPLLTVATGLAACGGQAPLPTPRPLVIPSGVRLNADPERMEEVDAFVRRALDNIERDPSFLIRLVPRDSVSLLWEGLEINAANDTASIGLQRGAADAQTPYQIYAHLQLMARRGEIGEWIPEAAELVGFDLERSILKRISDVWLYGRAIYDAAPYAPMDQLLWSTEAGYLDAYILTARGDEFREEREEWLAAQAGGGDTFRAWFRATFETNPPGVPASGN